MIYFILGGKMARKKVTKASKRRLLIFGTMSFIVMGYFVFSFGYFIWNIRDLEKNEKQLQEQLIALKDDAEELETEIQKLKDPDYLARYARENYLYSKDGEYIIKIEDTEEEKVAEEEDHSIYLYLILGLSIALFGIIGLFLRYRKKDK